MRSTETTTPERAVCYHCGEACVPGTIRLDDKDFCCNGCQMVYSILNEHSLCQYYSLNQNPGSSQRVASRKDKFAFLDEVAVEEKLISFKEGRQVRVSFYLPQIHCSSCLYLLENLPRIQQGIVAGIVNFTRKEIDIVFNNDECSLREVVETLASIGYEPYISLNDLKQKRPKVNRSTVFRLGVAGFCFANIMLTSFPEYLGIEASESNLRNLFRWFNLVLSLPVLLYSAFPFYESSWKSLRHRFLNIDAPIALAIIITFTRSAYEVISGTGGGYFDSMTGIVFFMLVGRLLQEKTYEQLSFDRDYTSYFPVAVPVLKEGKEVPVMLPDIKPGDTLVIHHGELIPADGILTRGKAFIDYSFVTGEAMPVLKETGELLYAGGRQTGERLELLVIKPVAQSYLTSLWNKDRKEPDEAGRSSFVHLVSRYFTLVLVLIGALTAVYWSMHDVSKLWPSVTAVFIVACPCALLLSHTFTNGNIIRILGKNGFYLRNAAIIEKIAAIDHVVLDKTGTLTVADMQDISYRGSPLSGLQHAQLAALAACSSHPLSRAIAKQLASGNIFPVDSFNEYVGKGIEGFVAGRLIRIGTASFTGAVAGKIKGTAVYISFDNEPLGCFIFRNHYRENLDQLLRKLSSKYSISVLTGDTDAEKDRLEFLFGGNATVRFHQSPQDKLAYIKSLQDEGRRVMMIGDGLNDGAALRQSDVGVAVAELSNNFTPSSDVIMDGRKLSSLYRFIQLCRINKRIIIASFILSILYNIVGLSFAVRGDLSPLIAAILMPASSLSILLLTFGSSSLFGRIAGKQPGVRSRESGVLNDFPVKVTTTIQK